MFERYTEKARQVIFFARYEVSQFGATAIKTEHLLLGLLSADKSLLHRVLPASMSTDDLRKQIETRMIVREKILTATPIPLSDSAKNVLRHATEEADSLSHESISTEHILLGLLREENSMAAKILGENGIEYATTRKEFER